MENKDKNKKIMENAFLKVKKYLDKVPFIGYSELTFRTNNLYSEMSWYEYKDGKYYEFFEERGKIIEKMVFSTEDEIVDYIISDIISRYAFEYELENRHYFEDNLRVVDTIEEFCYNLIGKKNHHKRHNYDDEWAIISDLVYFYRKKCIELKEKYKDDNIDLNDIDYIINRGYADNPSGGMSNPKQSIKKAHDKIKIIEKKFPETIEYFKIYEKFYDKIKFDCISSNLNINCFACNKKSQINISNIPSNQKTIYCKCPNCDAELKIGNPNYINN